MINQPKKKTQGFHFIRENSASHVFFKGLHTSKKIGHQYRIQLSLNLFVICFSLAGSYELIVSIVMKMTNIFGKGESN